MRASKRVGFAVGGVIVVLGSTWLAWNILPGVKQCLSIYCGSSFDSGGANIFGHDWLTPAQTGLTALGILAGGFLLALAILPDGKTWTALGAGFLVLAVLVSLALPSRSTGLAPTRPCSTPGANGPVSGTCVTGPTPTDDRASDRLGLVILGVVFLLVGIAADRKRSRLSPVAV